jgi:hypothetical protein
MDVSAKVLEKAAASQRDCSFLAQSSGAYWALVALNI